MTDNGEEDRVEFDVRELLSAIWHEKLIVVSVFTVTILLSILYLHKADYLYNISLDVVPTSPTSSKSGALGGLASLTGINLPSGQSSSLFSLYLEGLKSYDAAEALSNETGILQGIYSNEWDLGKQDWDQPSGFKFELIQSIKNILGIPKRPWVKPSPIRLRDFLIENIIVQVRKDTSLVTISIKNTNPNFGKKILFSLHKSVDRIIRMREQKRSQANILYLKSRIATEAVKSYSAVLLNQLLTEEVNLMRINSDLPFVAEYFSHPQASLKPVTPNPVSVLIFGVFMGFVLSMVAALIRYRLKGLSVVKL